MNSGITVEMVLSGYLQGVFPMADEDDTIYWYSANPRAVIPIYTYKPSKSLRPVLNRNEFEIRFNTEFEAVMRKCARPRGDGDGVWISEDLIRLYTELHEYGYAHSVEAWYNNTLVGGLYGIAMGKVFFGESMFFDKSNASKVAFHYLIERLKERNFELLDSQFINDNVKRYGAIEIQEEEYLDLLAKHVSLELEFD